MPLALYIRALEALILIAFYPVCLAAQTLLPVPALSARAIDQTNTLSAGELQALNQQLQALEEKTGAQVVVLMLASTAPEDIAAYAHRVASDWKIGRRDVGDGVLVLVAKNDRRMRLEVARTLEGAIPDLAAARIIDAQMAPHFRSGDYASGLSAAIAQLSARISGEALPAPTRSKQSSADSGDGGIDLQSLAMFLFFGVTLLAPLLRQFLGRFLGSAAMGGGTGLLAYWLSSSVLWAGVAGGAALLLTLLSSGKGGSFLGGGGMGGRRGGGFSSGGGGSFGGGGASGRW